MRIFRRSERAVIVPSTGWTVAMIALTSAAMTFLSVLTLAAGLATDRLARDWRSDLSGVATVRIVGAGAERERHLRAVVEVLRTTPGIAGIRVLGEEEQMALLLPWLGADLGLEDLPVPQLIDVALEGTGPDQEALQDRLSRTGATVTYDDHAAWREPLAGAAHALQRLALIATGFCLVTAAVMIGLAARLTLLANRETISLVRLIGGEDRFIARSFVSTLTWRAWIGAVFGTAAGVLAIALMPRLDDRAALEISLAPDPLGWIALGAGVPAAAGLVAWAAARITVRITLARML